ncbi:putative pentatricopeptide repeat-containing protein At5g52630 isoform X2 [Humulus lupulus]|uniref:putative pentatricopeptide repeat-containing protein At5g52630 isoform X2 n=1 Tax=Humulus lupulus TaxID=3486 RepID=UPI002B40218B|nr:putative pentatricopeptide repeat-containing protein At5g52630 isoform X2 [Humulus lupulus]
MASLPSSVAATAAAAVNGGTPNPKLESSELRTHSVLFPTQKEKQKRVSSDSISTDFREALSAIREDASSESSYYVDLLRECIEKNSVSDAEMVHAQIIKTGILEDVFVSTFLVNVYVKCGNMGNARKLFENLPRRNVVAWTTLMTGYVNNFEPHLAIQVFREMLEAGTYPTNYTLGIVINACSSLQSINMGEQLHGYMIKYHIDFDTSIGNSLCSLYAKSGHLSSAVKVFENIREKNVISWTAIISAFSDNGDAAGGLEYFIKMLSEDIQPNEFTLTSVLSLCCVMLSFGIGSQVHSLSIKLGFESNLRVKNSIMYLYLKTGRIQEAKRLFDGMKVNSLVTWNLMISGHAQMIEHEGDSLSAYQSGNQALYLFSKLNRSGMKPDLFTFSSVLTLCGSLVALEQGEQVHAQTIKSGFLSDVVVGTALISMYNKCGSIEKASKAFVEMSIRTLISWTSMITSLAHHGRTQQALQLFEDMILTGVRPNQITFVGVLSACSHAGMVEEALGYFEMMQKQYKIKPVMDHYACLIAMFVRLGRLDEAFNFIKKMDFEPSEFIWSTLVAGCRSHGNSELGFYAAEQLLKLKPKDTETYGLLLNMYCTEKRWKDVSKVKKMMKEEKIGKIKDWSWISIKDKVYSFKADESHHHSEDFHNFLVNLIDQAKSMGYESLKDLEVAEEEEVEESSSSSTTYHSEKLALAFGLLNTPSFAPIRVIKNFIMCRDCHNFIKTVSVLTGREIAIRDSRSLHKIVNGKCSCGDFW